MAAASVSDLANHALVRPRDSLACLPRNLLPKSWERVTCAWLMMPHSGDGENKGQRYPSNYRAVGEQSQREGGGRGGEEDRYRVWLVSRGEHALHDIRGRRRVLFSQL